jgi:peptide/nickel transport system substrate-binding protein
MFTKRYGWQLLFIMVAALLLAAQCGGGQPAPQEPAAAEPTEAPAAEEPAAEAPAATEEPAAEAPATEAAVPTVEPAPTEEAAAEPASGGGNKVVTISFTQEPSTLNPLYTNQWFMSITTNFWLERPWNFDENNEPYPVLLTEMPGVENGGISEDGKTLTMHLKDGLTWSDGEPLTSEDFVFTWQMYMADNNLVTTRYPYDEFVTDVTAPDPQTVVVEFSSPFAAWQANLFVLPNGGTILPKHVLQPVFDSEGNLDNAEWNRAPTVGIGPFVFNEWESGSHISFVRNPNYYGTPPKVDEIFIRIVPDDAAQVAALKTGDADIGTFISNTDVPDLKDAGIGIETVSSGYNESWFLNMRPETAHPAMLDVNVRKALAMGFNREQIAQDLLFGLTKPAATFWDGSAWADPAIQAYSYDPEQAMQLLDEAGWVDSNGDGTRDKDGQELVLRYATTTRPVRMDTQAVVQQQLAEIGIGVELSNFESDVFFAGYAEGGPCAVGETDICEWSDAPKFPDPDVEYWLCAQIPTDENPTGSTYFICDEELAALFKEPVVTLDEAKRQDLLNQIQQIMHDNVYTIGIWQDPDIWALNPRLLNVKLSGVTPFQNSTEWDVQ